MKIGYFINFPWYPAVTGAGIHASQLAVKLMERGHTFHKIFYDYDIPFIKQYRRRDFFKFLKNIDLIYIRVHEGLMTDRYSLLKLCRLSRLPVVWEINAPLEENLSLGQSKNEVEKLRRKRKFLAKFVDTAIGTCDELRDYAKEELSIKNSFTIPLGSDLERFSPNQKDVNLYREYDDCFKIVWAGSAQYAWQALDVISKVARKTYERDKKIIFIVIGKKQEQDLKHLEFDNIKIIDRMAYDKIPRYIASCDAGLCLYNHQPNTKFYRSPLKLFDYMSCGLPVISTHVGQINSIIRHNDNGILVDENNNIDEIVAHIQFLKNNRPEAERMGLQARKDIERYYNWTRVAQETEEILLKTINGAL